MMRRELYVQRLAGRESARQATLAEKRTELEEVRAKYLEAAKARKVLDKLKDRQAAASTSGR